MSIDLEAIRLSKRAIDRISVSSGSYLGIIGPTDSGKTALLLALMGQKLPGVSFDRSSDLGLAEIGFVPSNPAFLFSSMKSTLLGEMQLSSQFLGRKCDHLDEIIHRFQIADLLDRDPYSLSGGEMARAALAIVSAKKPKAWLLDQIYDWLDPDMVAHIRSLFEQELSSGHAVVEAHSFAPKWVDRFDTAIFLDEGNEAIAGNYEATARRVRNRSLLSETSQISMRLESDLEIEINRHNEIASIVDVLRPLIAQDKRRSAGNNAKSEIILELQHLSFGYPHNGFAIGPLDLYLRSGETVAVTGPNGSGKTTFLQCLANLLHPVHGTLKISGSSPTNRPWEWPRKAFYCFQNPDDQIYLPTVSEEIEKTLQALGRPLPANIEARYRALGLTPYLAREPYQLTRPIRRMVCLAAGLISASPIILLDEPTSGLDVQAKIAIQKEITTMAKDGFIFVMVSHDFSFVSEVAERILAFSDGRMVSDSGLFPWPLSHVPPVVEIGSALNVEAHRYCDLVHAIRPQMKSR